MEGPAVTSALIHAATLVMAGLLIFLFLFEISRANESKLWAHSAAPIIIGGGG
jgi:NADH:ubiquinone oxidoreductase subunit 5 (subunit L)/multisubunit Na+/H+ antiporter MnhA subunit